MPDDSVQSLVRSVQLGELDIIQEAVKNDRKLAQATDSNGCSLLHWACLNNRLWERRYIALHFNT